MSMNLRLPHITGNDREQLSQIRSYLYQLVQQLQWEFNSLGSTGLSNSIAPQASESTANTSSDIKITKSLNAKGWHKLGTLSGDMCAVATVTVGGVSVNDQASSCMVDIATQYDQARMFLRVPSLSGNQISHIGLLKESDVVFGVYAYYNTANENTVSINIHTHMGDFISAGLIRESVTDSNMYSFINVKQ